MMIVMLITIIIIIIIIEIITIHGIHQNISELRTASDSLTPSKSKQVVAVEAYCCRRNSSSSLDTSTHITFAPVDRI